MHIPLSPLSSYEHERIVSCARGARQREFACKLVEQDDVPEPVYGAKTAGRRYVISEHDSFDAFVDRLRAKGFTLVVRAVPVVRRTGHERFYSIRRTRDIRVGDPLVSAVSDDAYGVAAARYA